MCGEIGTYALNSVALMDSVIDAEDKACANRI